MLSPNSLSNAQLLIGKYKLEGGPVKTGTANIAKEIVNWAESQKVDIKTLVTDAEDTYYFVNGTRFDGSYNERKYRVIYFCRKRFEGP